MRWAAAVFAACSCANCNEHRPLDFRGPRIDLDAVPIVYDDRVEDSFAVDEREWSALRGLFVPPAPSAEEERRRIRAAIAMFEQIAGRQTRTHLDMAKNQGSGSGHMDCTDESTNTTTYLRVLAERGLLKWHEVLHKAFRGPLELDTHWTAQIRDLTSGQRYVVDSWYRANGEPPYIQATEDWKRKRPFPDDPAE